MNLTTNHVLKGSISHLYYCAEHKELTLFFDDESMVEITTITKHEMINLVRNFVVNEIGRRTPKESLTSCEIKQLAEVLETLSDYYTDNKEDSSDD